MADITRVPPQVGALLGAVTKPVEAAEVIQVGEAVYINSSGKAALADADAAASAKARGIVVAVGGYGKTTAAAGDMVDVTFYGPVGGYSGLTPGNDYYSSTNPGEIEDSAPGAASGDFKWIIGYALKTGVLFVCPYTDDLAAQ